MNLRFGLMLSTGLVTATAFAFPLHAALTRALGENEVELVGKEEIVLHLGQIALGYDFKDSSSRTKRATRHFFRYTDSIEVPDRARVVSDHDFPDRHERTIEFTITGHRLFGDIADCQSTLVVQRKTTCWQEACDFDYSARFNMPTRGTTTNNCRAN